MLFSHTCIAALSREEVKLSRAAFMQTDPERISRPLTVTLSSSGAPKDGMDLDPYRLFLSILYSFIS